MSAPASAAGDKVGSPVVGAKRPREEVKQENKSGLSEASAAAGEPPVKRQKKGGRGNKKGKKTVYPKKGKKGPKSKEDDRKAWDDGDFTPRDLKNELFEKYYQVRNAA